MWTGNYPQRVKEEESDELNRKCTTPGFGLKGSRKRHHGLIDDEAVEDDYDSDGGSFAGVELITEFCA